MSTKNELQRMRSALSKLPKGPSRRIPPDVRRRVAEYARRRVAEGVSRGRVAREVGISEPTVSRLLMTEPSVAMLPVRVSSSSGPALTVRGPAGLSIEGLDVEGLAALLRALS